MYLQMMDAFMIFFERDILIVEAIVMLKIH